MVYSRYDKIIGQCRSALEHIYGSVSDKDLNSNLFEFSPEGELNFTITKNEAKVFDFSKGELQLINILHNILSQDVPVQNR